MADINDYAQQLAAQRIRLEGARTQAQQATFGAPKRSQVELRSITRGQQASYKSNVAKAKEGFETERTQVLSDISTGLEEQARLESEYQRALAAYQQAEGLAEQQRKFETGMKIARRGGTALYLRGAEAEGFKAQSSKMRNLKERTKAALELKNAVEEFERNNPTEKLILKNDRVVGIASGILNSSLGIKDYENRLGNLQSSARARNVIVEAASKGAVSPSAISQTRLERLGGNFNRNVAFLGDLIVDPYRGGVEALGVAAKNIGQAFAPGAGYLLRTGAQPFEDVGSLIVNRRLSDVSGSQRVGDFTQRITPAVVESVPYFVPGLGGIYAGVRGYDALRAGKPKVAVQEALFGLTGGLARIGGVVGGLGATGIGAGLGASAAIDATKQQRQLEADIASYLRQREAYVKDFQNSNDEVYKNQLRRVISDYDKAIYSGRDQLEDVRAGRIAAVIGTIASAGGLGALAGREAARLSQVSAEARRLGVSTKTLDTLKKAEQGTVEYSKARLDALRQIEKAITDKQGLGILRPDKININQLNREFPRATTTPDLQRELAQKIEAAKTYGPYVGTTKGTDVGLGTYLGEPIALEGFAQSGKTAQAALRTPNRGIEATGGEAYRDMPTIDILGKSFQDVGINPLRIPFNRLGGSLATKYGSAETLITFGGKPSKTKVMGLQIIKTRPKSKYVYIEEYAQGRASRRKIQSGAILEITNPIIKTGAKIGKAGKPIEKILAIDEQGRKIIERQYSIDIREATGKIGRRTRGTRLDIEAARRSVPPKTKYLKKAYRLGRPSEELFLAERVIETAPGSELYIDFKPSERIGGPTSFFGEAGEVIRTRRVLKTMSMPTRDILLGKDQIAQMLPKAGKPSGPPSVVVDVTTNEPRFNVITTGTPSKIISAPKIGPLDLISLESKDRVFTREEIGRAMITGSAPGIRTTPKISKLLPRAPRIVTGLVGPESAFAGTGLYEVGLSGSLPGNVFSIRPRDIIRTEIRSSAAQRSGIMNDLDRIGKVANVSRVSPSISPRPRVSVAPALRPVQVSRPAIVIRAPQVSVTIPRPRTASPPANRILRPGIPGPSPRPRPPKFDGGVNPMSSRTRRRPRRALFVPEIRRRGRFRSISGPIPIEIALGKASGAVQRNLAASFRIREASTGRVIQPRFSSPFFRPAKRERGVIVQRRERRLSSPLEVKEIRSFFR